ncbi:MAG: RNA 2',3'-cyclic phosphodiesterase [Candidatus Omnitrophota bacterium]
MRAFIAIELPQDIKDYLQGIQHQLKDTGADVKWVEPKNIHLTLKFLGEIDDKKLESLTYILQEAVTPKTSFHIRISSLGAFPGLNSMRVIWAGIDKGDKEAKEIATELEENLSKSGIPKETRGFLTHITIGRVKSPLNRVKLIQALAELKDNPAKLNLEFVAKEVSLFKSNLTPKGPIYEVLKAVSLKTI